MAIVVFYLNSLCQTTQERVCHAWGELAIQQATHDFVCSVSEKASEIFSVKFLQQETDDLFYGVLEKAIGIFFANFFERKSRCGSCHALAKVIATYVGMPLR